MNLNKNKIFLTALIFFISLLVTGCSDNSSKVNMLTTDMQVLNDKIDQINNDMNIIRNDINVIKEDLFKIMSKRTDNVLQGK